MIDMQYIIATWINEKFELEEKRSWAFHAATDTMIDPFKIIQELSYKNPIALLKRQNHNDVIVMVHRSILHKALSCEDILDLQVFKEAWNEAKGKFHPAITFYCSQADAKRVIHWAKRVKKARPRSGFEGEKAIVTVTLPII